MKSTHLFLTAAMALGFSLAHDAQAANKNDIKSAITQQINKVNKRAPNKVDSFVEVVTVSNGATRLALKKVKTPRNIRYLGSKVTDCTNPGKRCKQRFYMSFDANKACSLDGVYALNFQVTCQRGAPKGACTPSPHRIVLSLKSENFCATKGNTK